MKEDTRLREPKVGKTEGVLSASASKTGVNGVSRLSDEASDRQKTSDPRSETISIRPWDASSVPGSLSRKVSSRQKRTPEAKEGKPLKGRSVARSRGGGGSHQRRAPSSQPKGCPDNLRGGSKDTWEATPRYPHRVFVLRQDGTPLMPCPPRKARKLLKLGEAVVARRLPFTIRLKRQTSSNTQPIELKFDPGSVFTGIALVANDAPLFLAELEHRGRLVSKHLEVRSKCRRRRRTSNLRYRPVRFSNRIGSKRKGWIPPSLRNRIENVRTWVRKFRSLAPITGLAQELVRFDFQKMENQDISGVEYQQGTLMGYELREYLLMKWGHKCAYCDVENVQLFIEHVIPRARGGSDRESNLAIACESCNIRKGTRSIEDFLASKPDKMAVILSQLKRPLKDASVVNILRRPFYNELNSTGLPVRYGSGGRTKWNRSRFGVPKSHALDALCVGEMDRVRNWNIPTLKIKSVGRGSHQLVITDIYGFPRTSPQEPKKRVRNLIIKGGESKGERRSEMVSPKGEPYKLKGSAGKRPHRFATGDTIRLPDGSVGRVIAARVSLNQKINVKGVILNKTANKLTLVERACGYDLHF